MSPVLTADRGAVGAIDPLTGAAGGAQDPTQPPTQQPAQQPATTPSPGDPTKPRPVVMTGAQWSAAQSAPASALASGDPEKATTNGFGRPLTGEEWTQAQRMTPSQLAAWKIPAIPAAPRDATRQLDPNTPTEGPKIRNGVTEEVLNATLGNAIKHPAMAAALPIAALTGPLGAAAVAALGYGTAATTIAQFGYEKALERNLSPDARAEFEADPAYVSGQAAAAQAILVGAGSLVHFGVKNLNALTDVSEGMTEAGAQGVKESNFAPRFSEGFDDAAARGRFAAQLEQGAKSAVVGDVKAPKGFEPTIATTRGKAPTTTVAGLETPEPATAGDVKPAEGLQPTDLELARQADAERIQRESMQIRRRPGGVKPNETPLFESPHGANLLGSMAARTGLADDASPYPPTSALDEAWKAGHDAVTRESASAPAETNAETAPAGSVATIDGVRYIKTDVGEYAHEHNPFVTLPESHVDALVTKGEAQLEPATPAYPDGFTMGGSLAESRLPPASEVPKVARGRDAATGFDLTDEGRAATGPKVTQGGVARSGTTLSDDPRYASGARRPLHLVTVKGLVQEIVDLDEKRADATQRAVYRNVLDENFHTTNEGSYVTVATRRAGGVSEQAKALQNLEDYSRIEREVVDHLVERRGIPADVVDELIDRERLARFDRAGAEPESGDFDFDFGNEAETPPANPLDTVKGAQDVLETTRAEGERRSLERAANTDDLTGLGNARAFREQLGAAEADPSTRVIRFDVNGFKAVNDALGHPKGDEVLQTIGAAIRSAAPDLPAFRVGGDEYAVFAPAEQADAVRDAVEQAVGVHEVSGRHLLTGAPETRRLSISGGVGETNAEADVAATARKAAQRAAQGIPDSRSTSRPGLEPVEGTGDTRTRGLATRVQERALANRLELGVGELPEYRRLNMADQAARATQLLDQDPALAAKVARGTAPAPTGLLPESVFVAVEQRAIEHGDVNTLRDLAMSRLTSEATTMGQRIRALGERDPDSPVAAMQDVVRTRSGGAANAEKVATATTNEVDAIGQRLDAVHVDLPAWHELIEALRC